MRSGYTFLISNDEEAHLLFSVLHVHISAPVCIPVLSSSAVVILILVTADDQVSSFATLNRGGCTGFGTFSLRGPYRYRLRHEKEEGMDASKGNSPKVESALQNAP